MNVLWHHGHAVFWISHTRERRLLSPGLHVAHHRERERGSSKLLFDAVLFFLVWHTAMFALLPPKINQACLLCDPLRTGSLPDCRKCKSFPLHITRGRICLWLGALRNSRMNSLNFREHLSVCRVWDCCQWVCKYITEGPILWNKTRRTVWLFSVCLLVRLYDMTPMIFWVKAKVGFYDSLYDSYFKTGDDWQCLCRVLYLSITSCSDILIDIWN